MQMSSPSPKAKIICPPESPSFFWAPYVHLLEGDDIMDAILAYISPGLLGFTHNSIISYAKELTGR